MVTTRPQVTPAASLTHLLNGAVAGFAFVTDPIQLSDINQEGFDAIRVFVRVRTGGTAPVAGSKVSLYLVYGDDAGTPHIDGGLPNALTAIGASALDDVLPYVEPLGELALPSAINADCYKSFAFKPEAAHTVQLVVVNDGNQTLNAGNHHIRWVGMVYGSR